MRWTLLRLSFCSTACYISFSHITPGDVTLGIYTDSFCTVESEYSFEDYQAVYANSLTASGSSYAFDTFNANMDVYKTCQPCRAYNLQQTYKYGWSNRRDLYENNDGQGSSERNKYNCYDDADYLNCNQCYKFETHSDMAVASSTDLKQADEQGTILLINYKGTWYGNGTVGDAVNQGDISRSSSGSGYSSGWASNIESSSRYYQSSSSSGSVAYSAAGAISFLLLAFGMVKAYKRLTTRCVELVSEGGSRTPRPLIELS